MRSEQRDRLCFIERNERHRIEQSTSNKTLAEDQQKIAMHRSLAIKAENNFIKEEIKKELERLRGKLERQEE